MKHLSAREVREALNTRTLLPAEEQLTNDERKAILTGEDNARVLDSIHGFVASGGLLSEWCEMHDFDFYRVFSWIRNDTARLKRYEQADAIHIHAAKNKILREIKAIGGANIADAYHEDGSIKNIHEMPLQLQRAIVSIRSGVSRAGAPWHEIKTADKLKALELYGKTLALFIDHRIPETSSTLEEIVLKSYERGQQNERQRIEGSTERTEPDDRGLREPADRTTRGQDQGDSPDQEL